MFYRRQPVIDVLFTACAPKDVLEGIGIDASICEMHAKAGQHRVNPIWHSCDQVAQKLRGSHHSCLLNEANEGKLAGSVNRDKEIELPFGCLNLCDTHVEVADEIAFEALPFRHITIHLRQTRYPMVYKTTVQG